MRAATHVCARCGKTITDGRDEEECLVCGVELCLKCYEVNWVCLNCEKEN